MSQVAQRICAVVVTYNRLKLLQECVDSLRHQTHKLDSICVVNNNSTDGTREWLESQSDLTVINQANLGGAGGFYTGIKHAYETGYDWIWVMDDDAEPEKTALEKILAAASENKIKAIAPMIVDIDGKVQIYHHKLVNRFLSERSCLNASTVYDDNDLIKLDANAFVGPMFHRDVVKQVGYPLKEYFIIFDDTEYTYRVTRFFDMYLYKKAIIRHKDGRRIYARRVRPEHVWKIYYATRNRLLSAWIAFGKQAFVYCLMRSMISLGSPIQSCKCKFNKIKGVVAGVRMIIKNEIRVEYPQS